MTISPPDGALIAELPTDADLNLLVQMLRGDHWPHSQAMRNEAADAIASLREAHDRACRALEALVTKLDAIDADPCFQGIWPYLMVHNYRYTGPNYEQELKAARAVIGQDKP